MSVDRVDWPAIRDRIFGRIDPISAGGRAYREGPENPNVTVYDGWARFTGPRRLAVDLNHPDEDGAWTAAITGDRFVLAAGGRAKVPAIPGLELGPRIHTSDTIMRIDQLPRSLVILGGGYIAAEFAHVFSAFGTAVTQVVRSDRLLRSHDDEIAAAFTKAAAERWTLLTNTTPTEFVVDDAGIDVVLDRGIVRADQ